MFDYYSATIFITVFAMAVMVIVVSSNQVINHINKEVFAITFLCCIVATIVEWVAVYSENLGPDFRYLNIVCRTIIVLLTPTMILFLAGALCEVEDAKYIKTFMGVNILVQLLSLTNGGIFYVDKYNVYSKGPFFPVYIIIVGICLVVLNYNFVKIAKKYQNKDKYILVLVAIIFVAELAIQSTTNSESVFWVCLALGLIATYNFYTMLISQSDAVTGLLMRRCYENKIETLSKKSTIIIFDVNDFKKVNDTYGHSFGDVTLSNVSKCIFDIYSNYGSCYRIGGDEFSVIIEKDLGIIDELNNLFFEKINEIIEIDNRMPKVSLGYGYFDNTRGTVKNAIDNADKMMYENKLKLKGM